MFKVLHPTPRLMKKNQSNHLSLCFECQRRWASNFINLGYWAPDEAALLANYRSVAHRCLLVPHHGSKTSSTQAFIEAGCPEAAIIPVGYRSRFGHPKPEVVARYDAQEIPVMANRPEWCG